jgi:hypothetical protein
VSLCVRFEGEADEEYRLAGEWYEERREGLVLEFFDAVDATIDRVIELPRSGSPVPRLPADMPVRRIPVKRFPYHIAAIMLAPWLCGERAVHIGCAAKADLAGPHKIRFELCVDHTIVR